VTEQHNYNYPKATINWLQQPTHTDKAATATSVKNSNNQKVSTKMQQQWVLTKVTTICGDKSHNNLRNGDKCDKTMTAM